jgi:nitroreductase
VSDADEPPVPPLLRAIGARRSLRAFAPDRVPSETLSALFEAARWAPSSGNGQPWRFVVTRRGTPAFEALVATLRSGNAWAREAPVLMLVAAKTVHDSPGKPVRENRRALLDLGLALENVLLQASHDGLIGHPMAGFDAEAAAAAAGVDGPYTVAVLLALGFPGDPETLDPKVRAKDARPRTRLPQSAFVFEDRWGAPASWTGERREGAEP